MLHKVELFFRKEIELELHAVDLRFLHFVHCLFRRRRLVRRLTQVRLGSCNKPVHIIVLLLLVHSSSNRQATRILLCIWLCILDVFEAADDVHVVVHLG